jgi:hypothetical protein
VAGKVVPDQFEDVFLVVHDEDSFFRHDSCILPGGAVYASSLNDTAVP